MEDINNTQDTNNNIQNRDTYSYKGWLNSNVFLKRALAVLGYGIVGQLILLVIYLGLVILILGIGALTKI